MKPSSKNPNSANNIQDSALENLFKDELKDIYWAEQHLSKSLPLLAKGATSEELKSAIEEHLNQTQGQISRLEQVFQMLGEKPSGKKCEAMNGLIEEAKGLMQKTESGSLTRDAAIISAAQKVEHYEIASYGTLRTLAEVLGHEEAADLLQQTLEEEKEADGIFTDIAENFVNEPARAERR